MGATLDETRVELEAQRARVRATADDLRESARRSFDVRAMIGRNPARTLAVVGGFAFLVLGGPRRTVRQLRRTVRGTANADRAYAGLPATLRAFVDQTAPSGPGRDLARGEMALALHAWRENPKNRKSAERLVSETLTPPGPERAFWALAETVAVAVGAIVVRQVTTRILMGSGGSAAAKDGSDTADAPAATQAAPPESKTTQYAGWSGRRPSTAGPAGGATNPKPATAAAEPAGDRLA